MQIKKLTLYTHQLSKQKDFFSQKMGFPLTEETPTSFSFQVGHSIFQFEHSTEVHQYHYCFLIPCNQLDESMQWLEERGIKVVEDEDGRRKHRFESWNANATYFYDPDGSVAEFICRHDLENESTEDFSIEQILCINEIGLPSKDVKSTYQTLAKKIKPLFWKGNLERFGTFGSQHGLFLLIDYQKKTTWFPTSLKTMPADLEVVIEVDQQKYTFSYQAGIIKFKYLESDTNLSF